MKCRHCNSINTRVTATEHHGNESWRYCRCLDCEAHYKTIETYAILKRGSIPGVRQHVNCRRRGVDIGTSVLTEENVREIRRRATENQTYVSNCYKIWHTSKYRLPDRETQAVGTRRLNSMVCIEKKRWVGKRSKLSKTTTQPPCHSQKSFSCPAKVLQALHFQRIHQT
jgi:hypothetical protein